MHTKGEWVFSGRHARTIYVRDTGREICKVRFAELDALSNVNFNEDSWDNAYLITVSRTAPHVCTSDCPGEINRRKLGAYPTLMEACKLISAGIDTYREHYSIWTAGQHANHLCMLQVVAESALRAAEERDV